MAIASYGDRGVIIAAFLAALMCDGATDDSAAWAAALKIADVGRDKTVELPAGTCVFNHIPDQVTRGVNIVGQGKSWTVLQCNVGGSNCVQVCDMGSTIRDLTIFAGPATAGGVGLSLAACGGRASGNHVIEHIWITAGIGGGKWAVPLHVDGSLRKIPPNGMRVVVLNDVSTFFGSAWSAVLWDCVGCEWRGGGVYGQVAIGGPQSVNIKFDVVNSGGTIWPGVLR